ncbi:hypothetical protein BGW80DRAFT_1248177 [Lactifluus volemus]|nr:hypothetical protein BGW80DRAFT_1248177 [Lactifluus volemus]
MVCLTFLSLSNAVLDALPPWFGEANEGAHTIVVDGSANASRLMCQPGYAFVIWSSGDQALNVAGYCRTGSLTLHPPPIFTSLVPDGSINYIQLPFLPYDTVREKAHIDIRESRLGDYSLFGYLPRGSGIDRTLGCSDLVLIDLDGSLHGGYVNDVTRTIEGVWVNRASVVSGQIEGPCGT